MAKKPRTKQQLASALHRQAQRPGQGPATGPYWIVMNLSRHKDIRFHPPSNPFRHPSEESALAEAQRLAAEKGHVGWRFGVFAFTGATAKIEQTVQAPEVGVLDSVA